MAHSPRNSFGPPKVGSSAFRRFLPESRVNAELQGLKALQLHREALGIREKLAPQSAAVAESLERVAVTTAMTGDGLAALNAFGRAVDAWGRVSPNSFEHASVIHELGAFLVRYAKTRIRFFYMFFLGIRFPRGTFTA